MKLISLREFVLNESSRMVPIHNWSESRQESLTKICNYANFLSRPIELGMFVPCDLDGNVLEDPEFDENDSLAFFETKQIIDYNEAKSRVLFEFFPIDAANHHISQGRNIEHLTNFGTVTLTETARKEIGL